MADISDEPTHRVPELVGRLYALVAEFETLFKPRKFTPDGHLVGSLGEVIAARRYGLQLLTQSTKGHDARTKDGRLVEIKATQGKSVALRSEPDHLIVLKLDKSGAATEVFNGPGALVWKNCGNMQKNGQRSISVTKLGSLMSATPLEDRLPTVP